MNTDHAPRRVAILTGAGGGIGRAIATVLAGQGWTLVLADQKSDALTDLAGPGEGVADRDDLLGADVTSEPDVARLVGHAMDRYGRIDGFISNAGIPGVVQGLTDYPTRVFEQVMDVNVMGTFLCLKHGLAAMQQSDGGSFVVIGSTSSIRGRAGLAAYVASKHAVLGLMRTAALEHVGTGVRVNAVLPGPTQTPMIDAINSMAAEQAAHRAGAGAVQRAVSAPYGEPKDVAQTVAFLLSPASGHMNGSALVIDGGSTVA